MYYLRINDENSIIEFVIGEALDGCIEVSQEEFQQAHQYKKFNPETREFSESIKVEEPEVPESEHQKITKETYETASTSADDTLLNMDLITTLDDKLNLILEHLGLC